MQKFEDKKKKNLSLEPCHVSWLGPFVMNA